MSVAANGSSLWITRYEAAWYARVHVSTIDRWIRQGLLAATKVRGRVLIRQQDLHDLIAAGLVVA